MRLFVLAGALTLALPLCAVEHRNTYQRTFQLGAGERRLVVENINGSVRVTGDSGQDVRLTVREEYSADTAEELARARNEVRVETTQQGGTVRVYLDGPFRDRGNRERRGRRDYRFHHDFELQAPRDIDVVLKTVNGKEVKVANIRGNWELRNVNGGIQFTGAAGSGSAETVNGPVSVSFVENPRQPSRFKTLNGAIDVAFQPDLSADIKLSTMNGDAYTDFDYTAVPGGGVEMRKTSQGTRYRISERNRTVRIASGGIEHDFKTLNGSIRIRKNGK